MAHLDLVSAAFQIARQHHLLLLLCVNCLLSIAFLHRRFKLSLELSLFAASKSNLLFLITPSDYFIVFFFSSRINLHVLFCTLLLLLSMAFLLKLKNSFDECILVVF